MEESVGERSFSTIEEMDGGENKGKWYVRRGNESNREFLHTDGVWRSSVSPYKCRSTGEMTAGGWFTTEAAAQELLDAVLSN